MSLQGAITGGRGSHCFGAKILFSDLFSGSYGFVMYAGVYFFGNDFVIAHTHFTIFDTIIVEVVDAMS